MNRIAPDSLPRLPARPRDGHKGQFGRVLVVGGSRGMIGAPALAGLAAFRGGAGLVTLAVPEPIQLACATLCPCATSLPLPTRDVGELTPGALRVTLNAADSADCLAVGPGMGVGADRQNLLHALLGSGKPLVLDADGLNNLARIDRWHRLRTGPMVLTPHPGEFARLTGRSVCDVQADRPAAVREAIESWRSGAEAPLVLVLKGAGTLVTDGERLYENNTGNPGLATGGTGDVLTGLSAGLACQELGLFDAVCLAVRTHGRAGDLAACRRTETALLATDLLVTLPDALAELHD
jgi:ADP-dependent NAD(P)H-hydrate dehydratase